ncbi:MAG: hypothetical protein QOI10_4363 [Solirubrobacterales bacterium]|jgi:hypothetical protein|nr:hypothetical protein [Solirubrobacterales bacterium]
MTVDGALIYVQLYGALGTEGRTMSGGQSGLPVNTFHAVVVSVDDDPSRLGSQPSLRRHVNVNLKVSTALLLILVPTYEVIATL